MSDASQEAKQAGRGVIFIAFAKLYFILVGFVIEFGLPLILSIVVLGSYKVVTSSVNWLNAVFITGTIQAVSRFTAQRPEHARQIQLAGFRMHVVVALPVAAAFVLATPLIARLLQDDLKRGPMMLAGLIGLGYAFYAVFVGTANGKKEFHKQAGLDITMATLRAIGILGMTAAGLGVTGAITGWLFATGAMLVISSFVVGLPVGARASGERQPLKPMIGYFVGVAVYLILLNLILAVDTWLLKSLSTHWFEAREADLEAAVARVAPAWAQGLAASIHPSALADSQVGFYGVVQNFARLSYQLIIAATFVVFPLVSRSTFADDRDATRRYITTTVRYSLIFAAGIASVIAANPGPILGIPYGAAFAEAGASALTVLSLGSVAFAVFAIAGTILNGAGLTRPAIVSAAVTLVLAAAANAAVIPRFEPGPELLLACAAATGSAMLVGAAVSGWFLSRHLGAFMPARSAARVVTAVAVALGAARLLPFGSPLLTLIEAGVVGCVFLAVLVVTRELGAADLRAVTGLARRGGKQGKGEAP